MAEGRCYLSSYLTGQSPNTFGACSPAEFVRWEDRSGVLESRLNNVLIDRFGTNETAGYPTLCKGRFTLADEPGSTPYHALEEPTSLNTMELLPELLALGIRSLKLKDVNAAQPMLRKLLAHGAKPLIAVAPTLQNF